MRHLKRGRKLNRTSSHRKAMFRNMVTSLLEHGRIETTLPKAKELRGIAEKMITHGKKAAEAERPEVALHHRRLAARYVRSSEALHKIFTEYAQRYEGRQGGYTRIYKLGWRRGDAASMAIIELLPESETGGAARNVDAPDGEAAPVTSKETFDDAAE
ncbi:MAG: large subunit ribosomal protein L17 [Myxococcota bacterium]|jgi:large subunit ribosomal protein L17